MVNPEAQEFRNTPETPTLVESPLNIRETQVGGVNWQILTPPRVEGWLKPVGTHHQLIKTPSGREVDISYLIGAKKDKISSADTVVVLIGEHQGSTIVLTEVCDYLSPHDESLRNWTNYIHGWMHSDSEYWGGDLLPDVYGANAMTNMMANEQPTFSDHSILILPSYLLPQIPKVAPIMRDVGMRHHYPANEWVTKKVISNYLVARNGMRDRHVLDLVNDAQPQSMHGYWRNYWMNAVISVQAILVGPDNIATVGWSRSTADILRSSGLSAVYSTIKQEFVEKFPSIRHGIGNGYSVSIDVNQPFDALAGVLSEPDYHNKCGPEGIYMAWGPKVHQSVPWETYMYPKSDHDEISFSDYHTKAIASGTDGLYHQTRELQRTNAGTSIRFEELNQIMDSQGPIAILKEVTCTDDYAHCIAQIRS